MSLDAFLDTSPHGDVHVQWRTDPALTRAAKTYSKGVITEGDAVAVDNPINRNRKPDIRDRVCAIESASASKTVAVDGASASPVNTAERLRLHGPDVATLRDYRNK